MSTCPKCGAVLSEPHSPCPVCGATVGEPTASFAPVVADTSLTSEPTGSESSPVLVVRKGPQLGERFYLECPELTIGRDPDSGIFLNDITVSRSHAVLDVDGLNVSVKDTGSLNGTFVNGQYIETAQLTHGDILQIGTFQMTYFSGKDSHS